MNIELLYHLNIEDWKPLYKLSTKTNKTYVEVDKNLEFIRNGYNGPFVLHHEWPVKYNKDWLIRAKRDNDSKFINDFYLKEDGES